MLSNPTYSVVVPVFNSDESLKELTERCEVVFRNLDCTWELIFVDDGSSNPKSWSFINDLAKSHQAVLGIKLTRNMGKHSAVLAGFASAKGNYIITLDDDLQHPPEEIPKLIKQQTHDVVIGAYKQQKTSGFKKLVSKFKKRLERKILNIPNHIIISPIKMYKKRVVKDMLKIKTAYPFITALIFEVTTDAVNVSVDHHERKLGQSQYTLSKMIAQFSNLVFNNSSFLLKLISRLGFSIAVLSSVAAIYFLCRKLFGLVHVSGWTSLMLALLFIGGLILFSIGILGEYLIRIIKGVETRPPFFIQKMTNKENEE